MSNTIRPFDPKLRDFMAGRQGFATDSIWGEVGRSFYDAERQKEQDSRRTITGPRTPSTREPWFPFVDKWLRSVPMRVHVFLGCVGAFVGFIYGVAQTGSAAGAIFPYTVIGFILGFVTIGLAALAFKLLLVTLIAGSFLLVMYVFMTYLHH
jgi:hypothetical protein